MELITLPKCAVTWHGKKGHKFQFTVDLVDRHGKLFSQNAEASFYYSEQYELTVDARVDFSYFLMKNGRCRTLIENGEIKYTALELDSIQKLIKSTIKESFIDFINNNF